MRSRPPKPLKRANGLLKTNSRCHRAIHGVQALPKAVERSVTSSDPRTETYPGGGFALELALTWAYMSEVQEQPLDRIRLLSMRSRMRKALDAWPLHTADTHLSGKSLRHCQNRLAHAEPGDPYWDERVFNANIEHVTAEVDMVTVSLRALVTSVSALAKSGADLPGSGL